MTLTLSWPHEHRQHRKFTRNVALFKRRLRAAKEQTSHDFLWYPFDTLGTWCRLDRMFGARFRRILHQVAREPLLDVGCGDGDLTFFLESLGYRVHAIDYPPTNHNGMRGIRTIKAALASGVELHEVDLDSQFQIPISYAGLALMLGVLYHLKNPFFVLDKLAQHCHYCIFSTTVTHFAPDRRTDLRDLPVAYLLDDGELNSDPTNHWVFTEACLRRLVKKANWEIVEYATRGDVRKSVPDSTRHELRAFGILKSTKFIDPTEGAELLDGWHELEEGRWRWTARRFGVLWENLPQAPNRILRMEFRLHERLLARVARLKFTVTVNGVLLETAEYEKPGQHVYERPLNEELLRTGRVVARFELNTSIEPEASDPRELGLIVSAMVIEGSSEAPGAKPSGRQR